MNKKMMLNAENELVSDIEIAVHSNSISNSYPVHWHNYLELEIVYDGFGKHILGKNCTNLSKGSANLITYKDFHSIIDAEGLKLYNISFDEKLLPKSISTYILSSEKYFSCLLDAETLDEISKKVKKLENILKKDRMFKSELCSTLLTEIVITVIDNCKQENKRECPPIIQNAISIIHKDFRSDISITAVAEKLNLSPNYFGQFFKTSMGISFTSYVIALRLSYAARQLSLTNNKIEDISQASGFNSVSYFIQCFKKRYSISPGDYRKKSINYIKNS